MKATEFNKILNKKFGRLTVIREQPRKNGYRRIQCLCECGNHKEINLFALFGSMPTKSCGCLAKEQKQKNHASQNPQWTGFDFISGTIFNKIKHGAKRRNMAFDITIMEVRDLFLSQNKKCALTGELLTLNSSSTDFDGTASLDRIDSSKGYVKGNIQWVHKTVNKMKMELDEKEFIRFCQKVVNHAS